MPSPQPFHRGSKLRWRLRWSSLGSWGERVLLDFDLVPERRNTTVTIDMHAVDYPTRVLRPVCDTC